MKNLVRKAQHAGSWYTSNPTHLKQEVESYLAKADPTLPEGSKLKALIGPHAGFAYSGPNAAWAYRNVDPSLFDRVVLMGPSHKVYLDFVAQTACSEYATPLGNIRIDQSTVAQLAELEET
jgi:MEMO1 family protein